MPAQLPAVVVQLPPVEHVAGQLSLAVSTQFNPLSNIPGQFSEVSHWSPSEPVPPPPPSSPQSRSPPGSLAGKQFASHIPSGLLSSSMQHSPSPPSFGSHGSTWSHGTDWHSKLAHLCGSSSVQVGWQIESIVNPSSLVTSSHKLHSSDISWGIHSHSFVTGSQFPQVRHCPIASVGHAYAPVSAL